MHFDVNLATQPYEDARRFYLNWTAALTGLFLLCALLVGIAVNEWWNTRMVARSIRDVRAEIARLDQERSDAQAIVDRPENKDVRDKSHFLNSLIARKSFSWTEVFSELEKVVPPHLHVTTLRPELNPKNDLELHISAVAENNDAGLELLRRLEKSDHFRDPQMKSYSSEPGSNGGRPGVRLEFTAIYLPRLTPAPEATR